MFVNSPRKLIVQLPGDETHDDREECNNNGNRHQKWSNILPDIIFLQDIAPEFESFDSPVNLVELDCSIHQHTNIVDAESDDLNGVFESQRIPDEDQLIQETEDEECEVCWDGFRQSHGIFAVFNAQLELNKKIALIQLAFYFSSRRPRILTLRFPIRKWLATM